MTIRIVVDERIKFKVEGSFADRTGRDQAFSFSLVCDRVDVDQIDQAMAANTPYLDFFSTRTHAWDGVQSADGVPLDYTEEELARLFKLPGLPLLTWRRYLEEIGAKSKN